jgi:hypothetical protein
MRYLGGTGGGWVFYVHRGKLTYAYNYASLQTYRITADEDISQLGVVFDGTSLGPHAMRDDERPAAMNQSDL